MNSSARRRRRRQPMRGRFEALEARLLLASFQVDQLTGTNFTRVETGVSINNQGEVGFVAENSAGEAVYLSQQSGAVTRVSFAPEVARDYGVAVAINNRAGISTATQVAVRDRINNDFLLRRWDGGDKTGDQVEYDLLATTYRTPPLGDPNGYDAINSHVDINDSNRVVFVGVETDTATLQRLAIRDRFFFSESVEIADFPTSFTGADGVLRSVSLRPQISNSSEVVFQSASGTSILKTVPCGKVGKCSFGSIASKASGFRETGRAPGITDDGSVVAFYGRDADGPGIFISVLKPGADPSKKQSDSSQFANRVVLRIAGLPDELGLGLKLQQFDVDSRVGVGGKVVQLGSSEKTTTYYVTYKAVNPETGKMALYWQSIQLLNTPPRIKDIVGSLTPLGIGKPTIIAEVGQQLALGDHKQPTGSVSLKAIELNDPITDNGQVAFWGQASDGSQGVYRATPAPGKVLTVLTHGFGRDLSDPILGVISGGFGPTFLDNFYSLADRFENLPEAGSNLAGESETYVASWNSSEGWVQGLSSYVASVIAAGVSNLQVGKGISGFIITQALKESFAELSGYLNRAGQAHVARAGQIAEIAAKQIVSDLKASGKLASPAETRSGEQFVHLIGHSRGGAVNARVASLLVGEGYYIDQYTALDGYSVDWPGGSSFLADIDINGTLKRIDRTPTAGGVGNRSNYRVAEGLQTLAPALTYPFMQAAAIAFLGVSPLGFSEQLVQLLFSEDRDWRAPSRSEFEVNTTIASVIKDGKLKETNHISVVDAYLQSLDASLASENYALHNYLGRNRCDGLPSCGSGEGELAAGDSSEGEFEGEGDFSLTVVDGDFESSGALAREGLNLEAPTFNDPLLDGWVKYATDPLFHLSAAWSFAGDVALDTSTADAQVLLIQSGEGTSLRQLVSIGENAATLQFDLSTRAGGSGDALQVLFAGKVIRSIDLANLPAGLQKIDISGEVGRIGELEFRIKGPQSNVASLVLDDIVIKDFDQAPLVNSDAVRIDEGRSTSFTILHNDIARATGIAPASIRIERAPTHGAISINSVGLVRYTPAVGFVGIDTFEYSVADNQGNRSGTAVVTIEVRTDLPPVANDDSVELGKGAFISISPANNDFDPEGRLDTTSIQIVSAPVHGTAQAFGSGVLRYTPSTNYVGEDRLTYRVGDMDGNFSELATVIFEVLQFTPRIELKTDEALWQLGQVIDFGEITQGSTIVSREIRLKNIGQAALTIQGISVSGAYRLTHSNLNRLGPDGELIVRVDLLDFDAQGQAAGTLQFQTNDPTQPLLSVPLTGVVHPLPLNGYSASGVLKGEEFSSDSIIDIPQGVDLSSMELLIDFPFDDVNYLDLTLYAPDGASVMLGSLSSSTELAGSNRLLFSDAAIQTLPTYQYETYSGRFRAPYQTLADLGESLTAGPWRLSINHNALNDRKFRWWILPASNQVAPEIGRISDRSTVSGERIAFDIPAGNANQFSVYYELESGVVSGAQVDPRSGRFEWLVPEHAVGENEFAVRAHNAEAQWATSILSATSGDAQVLVGIPEGWNWIASEADGTIEKLELGFSRPTRSYGARIREHGSNGFVREVEARDTSGVYHSVWTGRDTTSGNDWLDFFAVWPLTDFEVSSLRITIDTDHALGGYESLDAVALLGLSADTLANVETFRIQVNERPTIIAVTPSEGQTIDMLQEVTVLFSTPMDRESVEDVSRYLIRSSAGESIAIASATYSENSGPTVTLHFDSRAPLRPGDYSVSVEGHALRDSRGIAISAGADQLLAFVGNENRTIGFELNSSQLTPSPEKGFDFGLDTPEFFEFADFDNDGIDDLVLPSKRDAAIAIRKGTAEFKFEDWQKIPLSGIPLAIFVADWNLDNRPDLIVPTDFISAGGGSRGYDILLNDGAGGFTFSAESPLPYFYGAGPGLVANVLGDAYPEIVQTGISTQTGGNVLQIIGKDRFVGYGIAAEVLPPSGREGSTPTQLFYRDFTGDGRQDLLTNNFEFGASGFVSLYQGNANGFGRATDIYIDSIRDVTLQVDDFDNDGKLDLILLEDRFSILNGYYDGNIIHFMKGTGSGLFEQQPYQVLNGRGAILSHVADLNQDGNSDIFFVVSVYDSPNFPQLKLTDVNSTWVWLGDGHGAFQPGTAAPIPIPDYRVSLPTWVRLRDVNDDQTSDIVLGSDQIGQIGVLQNNGNGALLPAANYNIQTGYRPATNQIRDGEPAMQVVDVNLDGFDDLLLLSRGVNYLNLEVLLGDPQGGFRQHRTIGIPANSGWMDVGDWNRDGKIDVVIGDGGEYVYLLEGNGGGDFTLLPQTLPPIPQEIGYGIHDGSFADVNLDGYLDLVVSVSTLNCAAICRFGVLGSAVYFGTGDGQFLFNRNTLMADYRSQQIFVNDLNGDLIPDLLSYGQSPDGSKSELRFFAGRGNGTFATGIASPTTTAYAPEFFRAGDVNRDGYLDLIGNEAGNLFLGDGSGRFVEDKNLMQEIFVWPVSGYLADFAVGDFDHDGLTDVVLAYYTNAIDAPTSTIHFFPGTPYGNLGQGIPIQVGGSPTGVNRFVQHANTARSQVGSFTLIAALQPARIGNIQPLSTSQQSLSGMATADAFITVRQSDRILGLARASESGSWNLVLDPVLSFGYHILTIQTRDYQGRSSNSVDVTVQVAPLPYSWHNARNPFDVNNDNFVSAIDVLLIINSLNLDGSRALAKPTVPPSSFFDVSDDEFLSPIDVLLVINFLNQGGGSGENGNIDSASESRFASFPTARWSESVDDFYATDLDEYLKRQAYSRRQHIGEWRGRSLAIERDPRTETGLRNRIEERLRS